MTSDAAAVAVSGLAVHLRLAWLLIRARLRRRRPADGVFTPRRIWQATRREHAGDDWAAIADAVTLNAVCLICRTSAPVTAMKQTTSGSWLCLDAIGCYRRYGADREFEEYQGRDHPDGF